MRCDNGIFSNSTIVWHDCFNSPPNVCIDVVIGNDQKKQKHSQNVGENSQLNVGDHAAIDNRIKSPATQPRKVKSMTNNKTYMISNWNG